MKTCTSCHAPKDAADFYGRRASIDGLQPVCKACDAEKRRERYFANHAAEVANRREYLRTPNGRASHKRAVVRWQHSRPEQRAAHCAVNSALRAGRLVRQLCCVCGKKAEAHHPDYSRPLDVVWLCSGHHKQAHAQSRRAA